MVISYKKLWKLLIDKDMRKQDLLKICTALQCDIADIMEIVPDESSANEEQPDERM